MTEPTGAPFNESVRLKQESDAQLAQHGAVLRELGTLRRAVQRLEQAAKADGWDEGYAQGVADEVNDWERAENPYRQAVLDPTQMGKQT